MLSIPTDDSFVAEISIGMARTICLSNRPNRELWLIAGRSQDFSWGVGGGCFEDLMVECPIYGLTEIGTTVMVGETLARAEQICPEMYAIANIADRLQK